VDLQRRRRAAEIRNFLTDLAVRDWDAYNEIVRRVYRPREQRLWVWQRRLLAKADAAPGKPWWTWILTRWAYPPLMDSPADLRKVVDMSVAERIIIQFRVPKKIPLHVSAQFVIEDRAAPIRSVPAEMTARTNWRGDYWQATLSPPPGTTTNPRLRALVTIDFGPKANRKRLVIVVDPGIRSNDVSGPPPAVGLDRTWKPRGDGFRSFDSDA